MTRWVRRLLIAVGVLVVLVVGAAVLVPMLVPVDAYKSGIEAAVRERTGRSFEIRGPMSFSVLPSLAFQAEQAVLGNAPDGAAPQMVAIKRLEVAVALLPLLSSRIEVTQLVLTEPDIALEIARDGRPNWVMGRARAQPAPGQAAPAQPAPAQPAPAQPAPPQPAPAPRDPLAGIPDVGLGDVRIVNGHFTFSDLRNNARQEFTGVNLRLDARGLDQPISAQGDMTWNAERMTLEVHTPAPRSLLGGTPGQVQVKLQSAPVNLDANLALNVAEPLRTTGTVVLAVGSPQRLARWIGPLFPADPAPLAEIGATNLRVTINAANELAVAGDVQVRNEKLELALEGVSFAAVLARQATPVRLRAGGVAGAALRLEGNFQPGTQAASQPTLSGTFTLTAPSLARLAAFAGRGDALAAIPGRDITAVTLEGRLGNATELNARGQATINGQALNLVVESGALSQIGQARVPLTVRAEGAPLQLSFIGQLDRATANRSPPVAGTLELLVPSLRQLAAWSGHPLADSLAPGQLNELRFYGRVAVEPAKLTITEARLALDQLRVTGSLEATTSGRRPRLAGRLAVERLDVNPYMAARPAGAPQAGGGRAAAAPSGAPAAPAGNQPPQAPTQAARAGWDDTPIDTHVLQAVDLDLSLLLEGLVVQRLELGRTVARVLLDSGRLDVQLPEVALYGGQARGTNRFDAREAVPALQTQIDLTNVQALPLLRALNGMEKLEGTITASWTLTSRGRSQRALIQELDGHARMQVANGALVGVNLAALVRSAGTLGLSSTARETQRTDFSDLSASYSIDNGVATTEDLAMASPLLRVQGRGAINLPQRSIDMRLETRLVATLQGQGGRDARGFTVPVHVSGPFDNLSYRPDLSGISREELQELTRNPGELLRNPGEALRNLIPGRQPQQPAQSDPQQPQPQEQQQQQQPQQRQLPNLPFRIPGLGR